MANPAYTLNPIGRVCSDSSGVSLKIDVAYRAALKGVEGFSHLNVLWWFDLCDDLASRTLLETERPYRRGPERLGVFATRSPQRPNPIALSPIYVLEVDVDSGLIRTPFIDAQPGTPVLDIKPYHPAIDRVKDVSLPSWCAHWPQSYEESANFDWDREFTSAV